MELWSGDKKGFNGRFKILLNRNIAVQVNWQVDQCETSQTENQNKYYPALHAFN